jgi:putative transposase
LKSGPEYARTLKHRQGRLGDTWHLDELFVNIRGQQHYLWRAVDQDGDVIDILLQPRRDRRTAERFFRRLMKGRGGVPKAIDTASGALVDSARCEDSIIAGHERRFEQRSFEA